MSRDNDAWIFIAACTAYSIAALFAFEWLAPALGGELAASLLVFLGVFAIHGAQELPQQLRNWSRRR